MVEVLSNLIEDNAYQVDPEVRRYLRDVRDHALRLTDKVVALRELLQDVLSINLTLVSSPRTRRSKSLPRRASNRPTRYSSRPTSEEDQRLGSHRDHTHAHSEHLRDELNDMPELTWSLGYPLALLLMLLSSSLLYAIFKGRGWLREHEVAGPGLASTPPWVAAASASLRTLLACCGCNYF